MIRKISLWDLFVTFGLGLFTVGIVLSHLLIIQILNIQQFTTLFSSTATVIFICAPFIFLLGLVIDGLANKIMGFLINKLKIKEDPKDIKYLSDYVKENEIPDKLKNEIIPYHWCKDYITQNEIESQFMPFLSKFGFYRGVSFLFLINGIFILIYYEINMWFSLSSLIIGLLFLVMSYILLIRSKDFFQHTGRTVFRHFLIHRHYKELRKK